MRDEFRQKRAGALSPAPFRPQTVRPTSVRTLLKTAPGVARAFIAGRSAGSFRFSSSFFVFNYARRSRPRGERHPFPGAGKTSAAPPVPRGHRSRFPDNNRYIARAGFYDAAGARYYPSPAPLRPQTPGLLRPQNRTRPIRLTGPTIALL